MVYVLKRFDCVVAYANNLNYNLIMLIICVITKSINQTKANGFPC